MPPMMPTTAMEVAIGSPSSIMPSMAKKPIATNWRFMLHLRFG